MKISIDRRVKMVPLMEINAGDEVSVGGFDYIVENIIPCRIGKDLIQIRMGLGWSCLLTSMANL